MASALFAAAPARAQDCPGNPDAIGTSRVLTLAPGEATRVGRLQYPQSLPLNDHEVVLTFDDGPLPPSSDKVLDILASQCVKATYFLVGEMARNFPAVVRRIHDEGHTIGTHSEDHPLHFDKLSEEKRDWEIDEGIADVAAAAGNTAYVAPFFRIPGLARSDALEQALAARGLVVFSVDAVADDWHRHIGPGQIAARAISRLEARGRGILLLHDIHPATAAALPGLLKELKAHGFKIVQVVPAGYGAPEAFTSGVEDSVAWSVAAQDALDDASDTPNWPAAATVATPDRVTLPVPDIAAFDVDHAPLPDADTGDIETAEQGADAGTSDNSVTVWPAKTVDDVPVATPELPVPSLDDIGLPVQTMIVSPPPVTAAAVTTVDTKASDDHPALRRGGIHAHRRGHPAERQHAGLLSNLVALVTPAAAHNPPRISR